MDGRRPKVDSRLPKMRHNADICSCLGALDQSIFATIYFRYIALEGLGACETSIAPIQEMKLHRMMN